MRLEGSPTIFLRSLSDVSVDYIHRTISIIPSFVLTAREQKYPGEVVAGINYIEYIKIRSISARV